MGGTEADRSCRAGSPNLNLTPDEKHVYGQLFKQADTDNVGVVTGEIAVKFFEKTRLDSRILGEVSSDGHDVAVHGQGSLTGRRRTQIWQIADKENRGFLTPAGFGIALRLIGHAQSGREPGPNVALQPGALPRFEGIALAPAPLATQSTGPTPLQAQGTGGGPVRIPPLTPEKVVQYTALFERQNPQNGMLSGEQAKAIFEKFELPNEMLGRIWQMADTELRGALVQTEFIIAVHLLYSLKTGALRGLPNMIPAALYEAATRRGPVGGQRQPSPAAASPAPSAVPRQLTGQAQIRTGSPLGRPPLQPQPTGDWLITPGEKARFDGLFNSLDEGRNGFIGGEKAVEFLSQSGLSEEVLAQIWDLADVLSEGRLTPDTFAVAMWLVRQQRDKKAGPPPPLPSVLPLNLIPPSIRSQARPPTAPSASAFDVPPPSQPPPPQRKSALDDLFGLDTSPTPTPLPPQPALAAAPPAVSNDPFASSPMRPGSPAKASPTTSSFKPFVPSSSFGRTLTSHATGDSTSSTPSFQRPTPQTVSVQDDLLGETDADASKQLTSDSMELANLSNQIGSLTKHMHEVQGQRGPIQNELNQNNQQKKNFEQRLAQLRASYEKEAKDVRALEAQLTTSRNETRKIQAEMAVLDGSHQDLQNQHQQVAAALQADRQENANLKERIRAVNAEIAQLKPQIEKLKLEARQQKGLVAINKKQLATNEAERDKSKTEIEDLTKSNEELARQINTASPPPAAAQVASPALSTTSANNPFFRRTGSADIMGAFSTPPPPPHVRTFSDKSFDDVFGPSLSPPSQPPTAVPTFKPQTTGTSTASAGSFATPGTTTSPSVSRQATVVEPPAPPESRQMSSSFLPFGDPTESLTSSRQVSPPASRLGQIDTSAEFAPNLVASPVKPVATGQSFASGSETNKSVTPSAPEVKPASSAASPFGEAPAAERAKSPVGHSHNNSSSDPFAAMDQAKAKEDFDSAFASFKTSKAKAADVPGPSSDATKAFASFHTEFPPVSELEKDDDPDSSSDGGGFDDDFAPSSPKPVGKIDPAKPSSPTLTKTAPQGEAPGVVKGRSASPSDDFMSR